MTADVLVIGAGIQGLSAAYHLARAGARVTVLEREQPGSGASGAAAGILGPHAEFGDRPEMLRLGIRSCELWPEFAEAIRADSGIGPELVPSGVLELAADEAHAEELRRAAAERREAGHPVEWLSPAEAGALMPGLGARNHGAFYARSDMHLEPPRAVAAAHAACLSRGVKVLCGQEVLRLRTSGARVTGVETVQGAVAAETVVLCGGAWSSLLAPLGLTLPVFPVKGQILAVKSPGDLVAPWVRQLMALFAPGVYMVPKRDGRLVLGATEEPGAGYDRTLTLGGVLAVGGAAARAFPALAEAPVVAHWAGLRPCTPDRMPLLGPAPGYDGLILATGHFRNGVLLAPLSGQAVAAWASGHAPGADLAPFSPGRFPFGSAVREGL